MGMMVVWVDVTGKWRASRKKENFSELGYRSGCDSVENSPHRGDGTDGVRKEGGKWEMRGFHRGRRNAGRVPRNLGIAGRLIG
jgi:hypothetical protein